MSPIEISFPGGKRVDARSGGHLIRTDQPIGAGGEDSAPAPFDLFLASLGTCAGLYVLGFCQARGISTKGIRIVQEMSSDEKGQPVKIDMEILLPEAFPTKYRDAVLHAADGCKVKRLLAHPPVISIRVPDLALKGSSPPRSGSLSSRPRDEP